ncbi:MAG: peptidoglycan DD-metalloendopeptidase family protein [Paracoccus sp. (in: a-proteobacteria)]
MSSAIFRNMAILSLATGLAGCQSLPAVQQDLGAIPGQVGSTVSNGINSGVDAVSNVGTSSATSFPIFGRQPGGAAAAGGGGTQLVTDPYAGQGVAKPSVPPSGTVSKTSSASGTASSQNAATAKTRPATTHVVSSGETGWSVARKYEISIQDLATANNLDAATMSLKVGQKLNIPAGTITRVSDASAPGEGTVTPTPPSASKPLPDEKTAPSSAPVAKPDTPDLGATRTAASGSNKFQMPVPGAIVRTYSKGRNDGIDISAASGTTVKAAASGRVAAITRDADGVPIVVVRHDGDLMTVYAGMSALSVQKGDQVKAGQKIGAAGGSGSIHFEVRKGFDSVNPENYL